MKRAELPGANQPLNIVTRDIPTPPEEGCLVKTTYAGVCHSDLHLIENKLNLGHGQEMIISDIMKMLQIPPFEGRVLGHEICGVIESFGSKADPAKLGLAVGDTVMVYPWICCGNCSICHAGFHTCENDIAGLGSIGVGKNPGGFSSHVPVPKCSYLVKLPENIPPSIGCMLPCSGLTAFHALSMLESNLEKAAKKFEDIRLLIVGAGGVGLWAVRLAKLVYKSKNITVIAADVTQKALDIAKDTGADEVILLDPKEDIKAAVEKITGKGKIDAAIDFVGRESTSGTALQTLRKDGILVIVGLHGGALSAPIPPLATNLITIRGCYTGTLGTLKELVELVSKNQISYPSQEFYSIDEVNTAIDKLKAGQVKGRAIIKF